MKPDASSIALQKMALKLNALWHTNRWMRWAWIDLNCILRRKQKASKRCRMRLIVSQQIVEISKRFLESPPQVGTSCANKLRAEILFNLCNRENVEEDIVSFNSQTQRGLIESEWILKEGLTRINEDMEKIKADEANKLHSKKVAFEG